MAEYDLPLSPEVGQETLTHQLFSAVSRRFENALNEEQLQPAFVYITTGFEAEPSNHPIASFNLAQSHEAHRNNEGTVLEISVPIQDAGQELSGLMLLGPLNSMRFFIVREFNAGQSKGYRFTDSEITPYRPTSRHHRMPYKIPKNRYPEKLLKQLDEYVIVPVRPKISVTEDDSPQP